VALNQRLRIEEGGPPTAEPFRASTAGAASPTGPATGASTPPPATPAQSWLYEPFPLVDLTLTDLEGGARALSSLRGRPAIVLLWAAESPGSRAALAALGRAQPELARTGVGAVAVALDSPPALAPVRAEAARSGVPVLVAGDDGGLAFAVLYQHLFMNRQPLRLPTTLLVDAEGGIVKVYRGPVDAASILADVPRIEAPVDVRLSRALPFAGTLLAPPGARNYLPYGQELLDQGVEEPAVAAFERAARGNPTASTLYRLGTLLARAGRADEARASYERALALQPDLAEASNDLGVLLAQKGDLDGAIRRFRVAVDAMPDYPDALNNLGYALLQAGRPDESRPLYERALALQPDFPEALNNLGLILGREGDLDHAEPYFRRALAQRPDYGEAVGNLAVVLVGRGRSDEAVALLDDFLAKNPEVEGAYLTLAKIHLAAGRRHEALEVLERLLQRNPANPTALELARRAREN
jgi:Flp pilus assembly protein TadD/peroxiredoxin